MLIVSYSFLLADTHEINNNGTTFTPDDISVAPGDTILFDIGGTHNVVEVSKETWDANGSTSSGGFELPFGGGTLVIADAGTFYYVCSPHASFGMKGVIHVETPSSVNSITERDALHLNVYPNPASDYLTVSFSLESSSVVKIELVDITGKTVEVLNSGRYQQGSNSISVNLSNIQPGRYFVHVSGNNRSQVEPLLIVE